MLLARDLSTSLHVVEFEVCGVMGLIYIEGNSHQLASDAIYGAESIKYIHILKGITVGR